MKLRFQLTFGIFAIGLSTTVVRADFDVRPVVVGGQIVTDGHDDGTGENVTDHRVFDYSFQQDPSQPFFTSDPGFNAEAGSGLPGGSQFSFNVLSGAKFGLPANLSYWDGSDEDPTTPGIQPLFGLVPHGESLTWNLGSSNLTVGSSLGDQSGFLIQIVLSGVAEGALHRHLGAFLNGTGGSDPTNGVYLIPIEVTDSDQSIQNSKPFFIMYNNGLSDGQALTAFNYIESHLVPEPSSITILSIGGLVVVAFRVRSSRKQKRKPAALTT